MVARVDVSRSDGPMLSEGGAAAVLPPQALDTEALEAEAEVRRIIATHAGARIDAAPALAARRPSSAASAWGAPVASAGRQRR
jgi:hypothetical protein